MFASVRPNRILQRRCQDFYDSRCIRFYSSLRSPTIDDRRYFQDVLAHHNNNPGAVVTAEQDDDLDIYNIDWTRHWKGRSRMVLKPSSAYEVSQILRYCNENRIGIVPQSGKTGLVGGSIPIDQEVVICMERMSKIHSLDDLTGILRCQSGCILYDLQQYCEERRYLAPLDLGSKGTCMIGGNISTNAGGQYYYRYGSLAGNLLGLEVVLADGRILDLNYWSRGTNIKDNTGYKLHQLFVGSEGTLGIITGVALLCARLPASKQAAFIACESFIDVLKVLRTAKAMLGEILAALEWMDQRIVHLIGQTGCRIPMINHATSQVYPYYLLVETHGSNEAHDKTKVEKFLDALMGMGCVCDGVLASDLSQLQSFWRVRESANPTVAKMGYTYKYDVSLPVQEFAHFVSEMQHRLEHRLSDGKAVNTNWGHVLDGNLHFNVTTIGNFEIDTSIIELLEPYIYEAVMRRGGSISAEHGLGQQKRMYLEKVHDASTLQLMRSIKELMDPIGILNPGKYLPKQNTTI